MSAGLLRCIKRSKKLYSRSIRSDSSETEHLEYRGYSRCLTKLKQLAKKQYYESKCEEYKHNTKKLWQIINEVCSKNIDKTRAIEYLKIGNIHEYKAGKISNHLGNYFSNIGKIFANKIPNSSKGADYYLNKIIGNTSLIMLLPAGE